MKNYNAHETSRMMELDGAVLAPFLRRAGAYLIDLVIAVIISSVLLYTYLYMSGKYQASNEIKIDFNFENWYSIASTLLYYGLATYFGNGKTLGKKLLKIRVVSLTHSHMTLWQSLERALGYAASLLEFGFGFMQFFINPNRRTVHDRIAETIVVIDK